MGSARRHAGCHRGCWRIVGRRGWWGLSVVLATSSSRVVLGRVERLFPLRTTKRAPSTINDPTSNAAAGQNRRQKRTSARPTRRVLRYISVPLPRWIAPAAPISPHRRRGRGNVQLLAFSPASRAALVASALLSDQVSERRMDGVLLVRVMLAWRSRVLLYLAKIQSWLDD